MTGHPSLQVRTSLKLRYDVGTSRKARVRSDREARPGKAALAGLVGGLAGAWAMSLFSAAWERLLPASAGHPDVRTANIHESRPHRPPLMHASQQEWDSTLNTATAITGKVLDWRLGEIQRERAAVAVHYAIGAAVGAAYAAGREYVPQVAAGAGAPFGAGVFLVAQEFGTPRLGLSKAASDYSLPMHANSLGEHVVWGVVTDLVSRALRRML